IVMVCPEVSGGLPTPRPPAGIPGGQGAAVLDGRVPVRAIQGPAVPAALIAGAETTPGLAPARGSRFAVPTARSPSCGNHETYDGSFSGTRVPGEGVAAAALRRQGVQVFNETELAQLEQLLQQQVQSCDEPSGTKR